MKRILFATFLLSLLLVYSCHKTGLNEVREEDHPSPFPWQAFYYDGQVTIGGGYLQSGQFGFPELFYVNLSNGSPEIRVPYPSGDFTATLPGKTGDLIRIRVGSYIEDVPVKDYFGGVKKNAAPTGAGPNDIIGFGKFVIVANAFDNTVTLHDADSLKKIFTFTLPLFSSPSYLAVDEENEILFVACNGNNRLYAFNLNSLREEYYIDLADGDYLFQGPGKIAYLDGKVYIPNANFKSFSPAENGPGTVQIVDVKSRKIIDTLETSLRNPTAVTIWDELIKSEPSEILKPHIAVTMTGTLEFGGDNVVAKTDGGLTVYDPATYELEKDLNLGKSLPSTLAATKYGACYLGSALGGFLMVVDLRSGKVSRGVDNPIRLTDETTFFPNLLLFEGYVVAPSFNTDEVFVVNTASEGTFKFPFIAPLNLSTQPGISGGPLALTIAERSRYHAYYGDIALDQVVVLNAVGNSLSTIDLWYYGYVRSVPAGVYYRETRLPP